jgi:hypothetical protein
MSKFESMSKAEITVAIEQTRKAIEGSKTYLNFLATGRGLPKADTGRQELAESHTKLINKMEKELDELEVELHGRA